MMPQFDRTSISPLIIIFGIFFILGKVEAAGPKVSSGPSLCRLIFSNSNFQDSLSNVESVHLARLVEEFRQLSNRPLRTEAENQRLQRILTYLSKREASQRTENGSELQQGTNSPDPRRSRQQGENSHRVQRQQGEGSHQRQSQFGEESQESHRQF